MKVYKIFNQYLENDLDEDESILYNSSEIMRFSHLKTDTFIFPEEIIYLNEEVIGYITSYVHATPLYTINPLEVDLDCFSQNIGKANKDIRTLSQNDIVMFDLAGNILYGDRFYVTDTDEFGTFLKDLSYLDFNESFFNEEIYLFLVDGYFNEFINNYTSLREMYQCKDKNLLSFIKELRYHLSEYSGKEIKSLADAHDCMNKKIYQKEYFRVLK